MKYSALLSVYAKEQADYLRQSLDSMLSQTQPPDDFVIVCDGPLTDELNAVLDQYQQARPALFQIVRLEENRGLGLALRQGVGVCRYEYIARMDSDDIAHPERCEKQLAFMQENHLDLCSGTVAEFWDDVNHILTYRRLPLGHEEITCYARRRNPMNHPCVMFRKDRVILAGNYQHVPFFEDFDLWIRMLQGGDVAGNLPDVLLYMRVSQDAYLRRGGLAYCKAICGFWRRQKRTGFLSTGAYLFNVWARCAVSILPNRLRGVLFRRALRAKE